MAHHQTGHCTKHCKGIFGVFLASVLMAGCGGLEWPAPAYPLNQASSQSGNQTSGQSNDQASAVTAPDPGTGFVNARTVIVGAGDTVYGLANRYGISMRDIIVGNKLQAPYHLITGQRIILPRGKVHTVSKGETLYGLSQAYDINIYDLARSNNIAAPYTIYVNQEIRIPGTGISSASPNSYKPEPVSEPTVAAVNPPAQSTTNSGSTATSVNTSSTMTAAVPSPKPVAAIPKPPVISGKGFIWPLEGKVVSGYGTKAAGLRNDGINIAAPEGSAVHAVENGVVAYAGNQLRGFGNLLLIKHANGYVSAYAHNADLLVKRGDRVNKGQPVAKVGSTGNVVTSQLHFELRKGKKALNPAKILPPRST